MFEGIVSDLLNRILGTYIENLDSSKLKISIWGGDVELINLIIKQSALDELELPVRPIFGYLKRLSLKIPWSKLYTERWEATIDGLVLVVVPNNSITYDPKKEEQLQYETKLATLARIEEAKERKKIQELGKDTKGQDGFMEKLIAQVIRNIQVQIKNIHIRYEDAVTCPTKPFAAGVSLQSLSLQSTDANWKVGLDTAKLIYKLLTLDGFLLYWAPNTNLLSQNMENAEVVKQTLIDLVSSNSEQYSIKPVLGPLKLVSKLQLNPRPEMDENPFSVPKASLSIVLLKLSIGLSRYQYDGMMNLLDSLDSMQISSAYRKFRPVVDTVKGNASLWWKYAYECKLENIKRIRRNWSWEHIQGHRERCRQYKELYKLKLNGTKLSQEQKNELEASERALDVFNITLVRKQAEMEQERKGQRNEKNVQKKGWFGGWLSWGSQEPTSPTEESSDIVKKLQAEMNSDEKHKLYEAIGYSEDGVPNEMPLEFADLKLEFLLEELEVKVTDEFLSDQAVCVAFTRKVVCNVSKRSAASALKVESYMQSFDVRGLCENSSEELPLIVESLYVSDDVPLLDVFLEINPLDGKCDTRVRIVAQPLSITYHSATIAQAADLFSPPKNVSLQQLQAAALNQLEVVKEKSVTGLQAAIDQHSVLDLNISIMSSRVILPELGYFTPNTSMIIMTLGSFSVKSTARPGKKVNLVDLASIEKEKDNVLEMMRSSSYDHFAIHLKHVQIVVAGKNEDWQSALSSKQATYLHLLRPLSLNVDLFKCLITSDPNLPKVKIDATLPEIALSIIDQKIIQAAVIANNCFNREATTPLHTDENKYIKEAIDLNENVIRDDVALVRLEQVGINTGDNQPTPQFTEATINFKITEIVLEMLKADSNGLNCTSLMKASAKEMQLYIVQKTFDLNVDVSLSQITADHLEWGDQPIIRTNPESDTDYQSLFNMKFSQVNPKSPDLHTLHKSVSQRIDIEMSRLTARLEQAALLSLLAFANNLQEKLFHITPLPAKKTKALERDKGNAKKCSKNKSSVQAVHHTKENKRCSKKESFRQLFSAKLGQVELSVSRHNYDLVALFVKGLSVNVVMEGSDMEIISCLHQFSLIDPNPNALHSKIVVMEGDHAWDARINVSGDRSDDLEFFDVEKFDLALKVELGTPKIVFLNKTVVDVMSWIDNFQSTKDAVVSASQAAAKAAKENLSEVYSLASKIKLDLVLKAPVIYVPHNSESNPGILLDLGKIMINNEFELGDAKNELGHPNVLDKMTLNVQNVKISRKQSLTDSEEVHLLQPFFLTMNIVRNLSISWLKSLPEIEIKARLRLLQMKLTEDDVNSLFAILQGNLGESPDPSTLQGPELIEGPGPMTAREREEILAEQGMVFKKLALQFTVDNIILTLFTSDENQMPCTNSLSSPYKDFARISLKSVKLKADMFSDYNIGANFILYDCILQDIRKDMQGGITTMMEKKPDSDQRNLPCAMIDLTFHQGKESDIFVDLKISEFLLLLHLPFLLRLQKFFSVETPKEMSVAELSNEDFDTDLPTIPEIPPDEFIPKEREMVRSRTKKTPKPKENEVSSNSVITIRIKVEQPDIVLVEDLSNIDTACIFLHTEIKCDVKMMGSQRNITAYMTNLQMYTSVFNPQRRSESLSQILTKSEIAFLSSATSTHADNMQVKIGTLNFRLAPDTVELFMRLLSCLSTGEEPNSQSRPIELTDWSDLWYPKPINFKKLPNLNIEMAEEADAEIATTSLSEEASEVTSVGGEALFLELECLLVTLEAGSGTLSIPLIKLQSDCTISAEGFYSSKLTFNGHLSFEFAYYNPRQAIWEPLLEPVERSDSQDRTTEHLPWRLNFEGHALIGEDPNAKNPTPVLLSPSSEEFEIIEFEKLPPMTSLSLSSKDPLEFCITKTFIEVLSVLSEAFMAAYVGRLSVRTLPKAPYKLINKTGLAISVALKDSGLKVTSIGESDIENLLLEPGGEIDLFESVSLTYSHRRKSSLVAQCQITTEKLIKVKIVDADAECLVPVTKTDKRYFSILPTEKFKEKLGLVTAVSVEGGCKVVTLSGCVKVTNELDASVEVYYLKEGRNEVESVCCLEPRESTLLPLHAVCTATSELFFSIQEYPVCIYPVVWKRLKNHPELVQDLQCRPRNPNATTGSFLFCAKCEVEQIFWANTTRHALDSIMIDIYLKPVISLNNLLPVAISLLPPGESEEKVLVPGSFLNINHADMSSLTLEIEIFDYRGSDWSCKKTINQEPPELSVWTFKRIGVEGDATLDLGLHAIKVKGVFQLSIYCPFWMVNKTGFDLTYKTDSLVHSIEHLKGSTDVVLFSFRSTSFFGKKKANIRVAGSDWSEKFPLDTVGSAGAVSCKDTNNSELVHQISIDIQLAASGLTKIVTFSPFYKAINSCPYDLQYCIEGDPSLTWHSLTSGDCVGVWPASRVKALSLRVTDTTERTNPIHFDAPHTTLFKLRNEFGGVFVEVTETEGGTLISFDKCLEGASSALILNHLKSSSLALWQEGHEDSKIELGALQMVHFTWESAESRRLLIFSCLGCCPITIPLSVDGKGVIEDGEAGWACWMAGAQRYVIVSEELPMLESPPQSNPLERIQQELELSFNSIGVSLVNDIITQEVMYLSMTSSGVVWEHRKEKGKKFRPFTDEQINMLEKGFFNYTSELKAFKHVKPNFVLKSNLEVDYALMKVSKPFHRHVRRVFQPGVWVQIQTLSSEKNFHMKVNKIQLDNQMSSDVMFPVVLARVPPPRGVMAETVPKPFFEMSVVMSFDSEIFSRIKYLSSLIQEFHLKVELPFIYALLQILFREQDIDFKYTPDKFEKDSAVVRQDLGSMVAAQKHPSRRDFYHHIHLSPIKMHLSFSLTGLDSGSNVPIGGQVIHLFLQSVGVTLTEVQDVVFRLGFFERQNCWLNVEGFQSEVISHYTNQVVKQLYVLVLGLDVLGNPFGLVLGVTKGFGDLFYEPMQGAVEGPGEFAEGLFYGVRSFMGKTVGGAAGAFSRITGTIGKGVASLTLDEEYQRRRREDMHKKPADGLESFARGGKGVISGVFDGVTGVFTKPISGAKEEGFEGFFKGVGKGVVGLVTRPASGVIDFAAGSFDAVMRATDHSEDVTPMRAQRFIGSDGIIKPFSNRHAIGATLLQELEKGRFVDTDSYVAHAPTKHGRGVLLVSDKRVFWVTRNDLLGHWKIEWMHTYDELAEAPHAARNTIRFTVRAAKRKVLSVFGAGDNSKEIELQNPNENQMILADMEEAFKKFTNKN